MPYEPDKRDAAGRAAANGQMNSDSTEAKYKALHDRIAALRETMASRLSADLTQNPQLADSINKEIDDLLTAVLDQQRREPPPPDKGLAELVGIGPEAADQFGKTRMPHGVEP